MKKEILINCNPRENRVAVLEDGKLEHFFIERGESERLVGNIYKGKVKTILPGLGAAFVGIGLEKDGFLPMGETAESSSLWEELVDDEAPPPRRDRPTIQKLLRKGQEINVQVVKEPIGAKGARLTTQISLPGRYLVLMPGEKKRIGISRKIARREDRRRMRELLESNKVPEGVGLIVRTAALSASKKDLKRDLNYLLKTWKAIQQQEKKSSSPALLHEELGLVVRSIRESLLTDIDNIIVDSKPEYKKINRFLSFFSPQAQSKSVYYRDRQPLFDKYNLEEEVEKLFKPKIWLKCGGYLVLNQTEALVAVDVNTGKHKGGRDQKATALKANLEAAAEVAKQLRLRNVGGIIVIDFIDMSSKQSQKQVLSILLRELKKDKAKTKVLSFSEFGLVQMTRQREEESFLQKAFELCACCQGLGVTKSIFSQSLEIERKLRSGRYRHRKVKRFRIEANPQLARYLLEEGWDQLRRQARELGMRLSVIDNASLGFQEYNIWALDNDGQVKV